MAGAITVAPFLWAKLFFPVKCLQSVFEIINDLAEIALYVTESTFYQNGMLDSDGETFNQNRNNYYAVLSNADLAMALPTVFSECTNEPSLVGLAQVTEVVDRELVQMIKLVPYVDTSLSFAFRNEWFMVGVSTAQFLANFVYAFFILSEISTPTPTPN